MSGLISKWNKTIYGLQLALITATGNLLITATGNLLITATGNLLITATGNLLKNVLQFPIARFTGTRNFKLKNVTRIRELKKYPYKLR